MKFGIVLTALLLTPFAALAQDAIYVRAGEHPEFSRLVIQIAPDRPWEFRTSGRRAELLLPEAGADFDVSEVFARIPKTRVLSLRNEPSGTDARLVMTLGCTCTAQASLQGALLIMDIRDEVNPVAETGEASDTGQDNPMDLAALPPPRPGSAEPETEMSPSPMAEATDPQAPEMPQVVDGPMSQPATAPGETVTPDKVTQRLLEQLNRAAEQGIIELAEPAQEPAPAPSVLAETTAPDAVQYLEPVTQDIDGLARAADRFARGFDDDVFGDSVTVRIPQTLPSISRPGQAPEVAIPKDETETAANDLCIDPQLLDIRDWSDERPAALQMADLRGKVFGEFDVADPDAALALTRLYLAHGFGVEALALIDDLSLSGPEAEVLQELANVMEDRPHQVGGHLDKAAGCGGNNDMWRAAALGSAEVLPLPDTESIVAYFAEMPILVRRLIGPRLIAGLLERDQVSAAHAIFAIVDRSAGPTSDALRLVRARLSHADGQIQEAEAAYAGLIRSGGAEAVAASILLTESVLSRGGRIPDDLVRDLEALSYLYRGTEQGNKLRVSEITAKAGSNRLQDALEIVRQESGGSLQDTPEIAAAADAILRVASADKYGAAGLATALFTYEDIVRDASIGDDTRSHLARQTIAIGLPNSALDLVAPNGEPGTDEDRMLRARAILALDRPNDILTLLEDDEASEARRIRAVALTKSGDYDAAFAEIAPVATDTEKTEFAWRAGIWEAAIASPDAQVRNLSEFMLRRSAPPKPDAETLRQIGVSPDADNPLALPDMDVEELSLAYAREVRERSADVRQYLGEILGGN